MKKNYRILILCVLVLCLGLAFIVRRGDDVFNTFKHKSIKKDEILVVTDADNGNLLPSRFRMIDDLNISGSAQFQPSQINNLKEKINKNDIYIVDLRQESHGFINDSAVSYYNPAKVLNDGFMAEETIAKEKELFGQIPIGNEMNLYSKSGEVKDRVVVQTVALEEELVTNIGMKYKLFAVKDGGVPSPIVVGNFVEFVKYKPENAHLHFHCDAGEGRTTTFMAMYQMMNNKNNKSLEEILQDQVDAGGIILTDNATRVQFLKDFYEYVKENSGNKYQTSYAEWMVNRK